MKTKINLEGYEECTHEEWGDSNEDHIQINYYNGAKFIKSLYYRLKSKSCDKCGSKIK